MYLHKGKGRESKFSLQKIQLNTKRDSNGGNERLKNCKANRKQIGKWQKALLISNFLKYKWIRFSNQNRKVDRMDEKP